MAVGTAEDAGFRAPRVRARRAPNNQLATPGRLGELILGSLKIAVDETVAPVLDLGRGRTKKGYFWAIAPDDRPWGGTDPPAIAYTYAPGRGAVHDARPHGPMRSGSPTFPTSRCFIASVNVEIGSPC